MIRSKKFLIFTPMLQEHTKIEKILLLNLKTHTQLKSRGRNSKMTYNNKTIQARY